MSRRKGLVVFTVVLALVASIDLRHFEQWTVLAATTWVGASALTASSGTTCSPVYSAAGGGNSLAMFVAANASTTRTFTVADGVNSWSTPILNYKPGTVGEQILFFAIHSTSATSALVVTSNSTDSFSCLVGEWGGAPAPDPTGAGVGNCTVTTGSCDVFENTATANIYGADNAGGTIDTSAAAIIFSGFHSAASNGGYTAQPTSGGQTATKLSGVSTRNYFAYAIATTAEVDEHCHAQQTSTLRTQAGFCVAFAPSTATPKRGPLLGVF